MAILKDEAYELPEFVWDGDYDSNEHLAALRQLRETSDALPDGQIVGSLLSWQRGDGWAYYLVVDDEPLTVQHVRAIDAWTVEDALIKGLDREDVIQHRRADRHLRSMFGGL